MSARMSTPCMQQFEPNHANTKPISKSTCATSPLNIVMLKADLGGKSRSGKPTQIVKTQLWTALDHSSSPRSPRET